MQTLCRANLKWEGKPCKKTLCLDLDLPLSKYVTYTAHFLLQSTLVGVIEKLWVDEILPLAAAAVMLDTKRLCVRRQGFPESGGCTIGPVGKHCVCVFSVV